MLQHAAHSFKGYPTATVLRGLLDDDRKRTTHGLDVPSAELIRVATRGEHILVNLTKQAEMIHYDAPHLTILWDDETKCVVLEWRGFVYGEMACDSLNRGFDLFVQKGASRWLGDMRKLKVWGEEETRWINDDFFPRIFAAGLRRLAYVVPESALAQLSLQRMMRPIKEEVCETAYFSTPEEAKRWLRAE